MPKTSRLTKKESATRLLAGVLKHMTPRGSYPVGGKEYTRAELTALVEAYLEACRQADAARRALTQAVRAERALERRVHALTLGMKVTASTLWGDKVYGDFGWSAPKKPGPKTVAEKVTGVRKRRGARAAKQG